MRFYTLTLEGSDATEDQAILTAMQTDWSEQEAKPSNEVNIQYMDTINRVGIWFNYVTESYLFSEQD